MKHDMWLNSKESFFLRSNWDSFKRLMSTCECSQSFDVGDGCYINLGTHGATVCKQKRNRWYYCTVNGWREKSFSEFAEELGKTEWEKE